MSKGIDTEVENGELLPDDDLEFEREYAEQQRKRQQEIIEAHRSVLRVPGRALRFTRKQGRRSLTGS